MTSSPSPWWLQPEDTPADAGLDEAVALERLATVGPNRLDEGRGPSALRQFLDRFRNPLIALLLAASAVSAFTGDVADFTIIVTIVLASVLLDWLQEGRAQRAVQALRESLTARTEVVRDGHCRELPVTELVPGDLVQLSAGDRVPADGLLVQARDLFVDQGLLTGESFPVEKRPGALPAGTTSDLQQALNAVFMGSSIISGSARMVVMATGTRTELGRVSASLRKPAPPTAFEVTLQSFGNRILRITLFLVLFVLLASTLRERSLLDSFMFALALAVGLTPELLPMVVSVTLARGAVRLARQRVIVKRQSAIQNLGAMDLLCTDKTGTLTEARMRLERWVDGDGQASPRVLELACVNSAFETGLRSPLDEAILQQRPDIGEWSRIDEVPFDFERRRVSVLGDHRGRRWLIVKGAPDEVLHACNRFDGAGEQPVVRHGVTDAGDAGSLDAAKRDSHRQPAMIDTANRDRLRERCRELEQQGLRVLAVACREIDAARDHVTVADETALSFAGFLAFIDPPKAGAREAIRKLIGSGVQVRIVTGDSELVTRHLCGLLELPVERVLLGHEIDRMDAAALRAAAADATLFCRVNPQQKQRVVQALRAAGHVVGYLGDGINDAPPLHAADVGLTVDQATEVAREVASLVMLERDLGVVHDAVIEGRRTNANVMKYVLMGTSSNFGNMISMAGASVFLSFLPMLPTQILLNNILYDLSEAALPLDRVDDADLARPLGLDLPLIQRFMATMGLISSAFDALTFWVLLQVLHAGEAMFRTAWFVESLITQVLVVFVIRTRHRFTEGGWPAPVLMATALGVVAVAVALPYSPLAPAFGLQPLPLAWLGWIAGLTAGYLVIAEFAKRMFYRRFGRGAKPVARARVLSR